MTTNQQQAQGDRFVLDHPGIKKAIADSLKKIGEHQQDFERAMVDIQAIDKRIAEFNVQIDASKSAADEVSNKIRAQYKSEGTGVRDAVKLKAQRRACLEEIEDFQWIVQDAKREKGRAELRAILASRDYLIDPAS